MSQNILFIMADQLRWDYLSCYGHPHLHTPHIDRLAARGVRFERAYANAPICGPSRACFYTGRCMTSHGVYWNTMPLSESEWTMADYLRPHGYRSAVVGKTHTKLFKPNLARLGIAPDSAVAERILHGGFEPFDRSDGIHSDYLVSHIQPPFRYNDYLRELGYDSRNPWQHNANSGVDEEGNIVSGWFLQHADKPANVPAEHSETAYAVTRTIECIEALGESPWCIHLSFIKPHWPYIAPAPYHNLYGPSDIIPRVASPAEREAPHPVYDAFMQIRGSQHWSRDEVRERVIPAYMGMVKQIDDEIGRLMAWLEAAGQLDETLIVFTSDHGDYLGDHWLCEKDMFHEPSIRIPLIIVDPSAAAAGTRGTVNHHWVESIDILPTFLDSVGSQKRPHRLEGRSLLPLLRGEAVDAWRDCVISESGYAGREPRTILNIPAMRCRGYMVRTERWKYVLWEGFGPQLFDLENDPNELIDLGKSAVPDHESVRRDLHERLFTWIRQRPMGLWSEEEMCSRIGPEDDDTVGVLIGYWREEEAF